MNHLCQAATINRKKRPNSEVLSNDNGGENVPPKKKLATQLKSIIKIVPPKNTAQIREEPGFAFMFDNAEYSDKILVFKSRDRPVRTSDPPKSGSGTVVGTDPQIYVSAFLLRGKSAFFKHLFDSEIPKNTAVQHQRISITLSFVEIPAAMDLIRCIYTNELVASTCVQLLNALKLADQLEIPCLIPVVIEKLKRTVVALEDHLTVLGLPSRILQLEDMKMVVKAAKLFVSTTCARFHDYYIKEEKEFRSLSLVALKTLISSKLIVLDSENTIWRAICSWMSGRDCCDIEELLPLVRFPLMDVHYLRDVVKTSIVFKTCPTLREKYTEALEYHAYSRTSKRRQTEREKCTKPNCFVSRSTEKKTQNLHCVFEKERISSLPQNRSSAFCSPCRVVAGYVVRLVLCRGPLLGIGLEILKKATMLPPDHAFQVDIQFQLIVNGQKGQFTTKTLESCVTPIGYLKYEEFEQMNQDLQVTVELLVNPQKFYEHQQLQESESR